MEKYLADIAATFARPWVLWLLAVVPVLGILAWRADVWRRRALAQVGGRQVHQLQEQRRRGRFWANLAVQTGLVLLVLAAAGPQWGLDWGTATTSGRDIVLVVDVSRSMTAEVPSRIEQARRALADLLAALRQRGGHRVGVVLFAGRPLVVCPLTQDYDHVGAVLDQLDELRRDPDLGPGPREASGTRLGPALVAALRMRDDQSRGVFDLLLLSDGDDPSGDQEWELGVLEADAAKVPISVVGVGDAVLDAVIPDFKDAAGQPVRTRLNEDPLRKIATATGGRYDHVRRTALDRFYLDAIDRLPRRAEGIDQLPTPQARYPLFLVPALVLLALGLGRRE